MAGYEDHPKSLSYSGLLPAERFLAELFSLFQAVRLYHENNQLVLKSVENLGRSVTGLIEDSEMLELLIENNRFVIQEEMLVLRREASSIHDNLLGYLEERGLQGLKLAAGAAVAPVGEMVAFARLMNAAAGMEKPEKWLAARIEEAGLAWVVVLKSGGEGQEEEGNDDSPAPETRKGEVPGKRSPRRVYASALRAIHDVVRKITTQEKIGTRKTVRMVQTMAEEIMLQEEPLLLTMSTIKAYDDYTFAHSVNVGILAMCIGKNIGLPREILERLGICGLFHDLGKIVWPHELLNKMGPLTVDEVTAIRRHSLDSTRLIVLKMAVSANRKGRMLLPPFEHHLKYDLSGYPDLGWKKPLSLCGRILAIADVYDALTSPRVYRNEVMSADRALGFMLQGAGTMFDPILIKVFINMLGLYPVGTLLELDDGELALVSRRSTSGDMARPWVLLLQPGVNGGYRKGEEFDLASLDGKRNCRRKIVASMNPVEYNIQPAEFLS